VLNPAPIHHFSGTSPAPSRLLSNATMTTFPPITGVVTVTSPRVRARKTNNCPAKRQSATTAGCQ